MNSFLIKPYSSKGTSSSLNALLFTADLNIINQILLEADKEKRVRHRKNNSVPIDTLSFGELLAAYRKVIKRHSIDWRKETHLYRFVLKLSMDTKSAWRDRFEHELRKNSLRIAALAHYFNVLQQKTLRAWKCLPKTATPF